MFMKMFVFIIVLIGFGFIPPPVSSAVRDLAPVSSYSNLTEAAVSHGRFKRQSKCQAYQWQCTDGTCIPVDGKCDGKIDCRDKSDETHALCRKTKCQRNWFRCTYGACVDGTAYCNGVVECVDQSDELSAKCRKDRSLLNGKFRCVDGSEISALDYCDGIPNCPDGSDETVRACADQTCPSHLFQCAYGACVDQGSDCNGRNDCADGSDEAPELCNKMLPTGNIIPTPNRPVPSGRCVLPPYPQDGSYVVVNAPHASPGQGLPSAQLNITCEEGYDVVGNEVIFCQDGTWSDSLPKCVRFCKLEPHDSVRYDCLGPGSSKNRRICNLYEPSGTRVSPVCNFNYFYDDTRPLMKCTDGYWNYIAKCKPDCGRLTPLSEGLIAGDDARPAMRGELPWHVAIYRKPTTVKNRYNLICGGSLVTNRLVISAAHCFWDKIRNKLADPSRYAVAIAKLFSEWGHREDKDAQTSEISSIKLPELYSDALANYQEDIALVILQSPFVYHNYVRPVCLDFNEEFNNEQLQEGSIGKVAGYGLIDENGQTSDILRVVDLPFVSNKKCKETTPLNFRENITGDKICAGYSNGRAALCKGDSGGGLSFPQKARAATRFYLRGVASTAPKNNNKCNLFTVVTFTQIRKHEDFIKEYL